MNKVNEGLRNSFDTMKIIIRFAEVNKVFNQSCLTLFQSHCRKVYNSASKNKELCMYHRYDT